jgi:hypothetical protein
MSILEFVARTFSPQLPDGRFVFRPWGARGPCYLLTARQRTNRAWVQLAYQILALTVLWPLLGAAGAGQDLVLFAVAYAGLNYVLFGLFSIGLPRTEKPAPASAQQRRAALASHSRALGRPVLWIFVIVAWIFVLGSVLVIAGGDWLTGLLCMLVFGACAATFTWQLWLIRKPRGD